MQNKTLGKLKKGEVFYRGYVLTPSEDFGFRDMGITGYCVVKNGTNPMPGACGFKTRREAFYAIDVLEFVGGEKNSNHFWEIMQPPFSAYVVGEPSPGNMLGFPDNGGATCGRWVVRCKDGVVTEKKITHVEPWDIKPRLNSRYSPL